MGLVVKYDPGQPISWAGKNTKIFPFSSPQSRYLSRSHQPCNIKGSRKGTSRVSTRPEKTETAAYSVPTERVMMGRVVSIEVAPPEDMGAKEPKNLLSNGASNRVRISRMMLDSRAITPRLSPAISLISTDDRL